MEIQTTLELSSFETTSTNGLHHFKMDDSGDFGGNHAFPTPKEYLASSLASCVLITLKTYIDTKDWNIRTVDCKTMLKKGQQEQIFEIKLYLSTDVILTDKQKLRLKRVANNCPIHKALESGNHIEIEID